MAASYPTGLKTFLTKQNFIDDIEASHVNDLQAEVVAIETVLGLLPQGDYASVRARLDSLDGAWTSWTPTWTSSGTNPTLGNGALVGAYTTIGDLVIARFRLTLGGTTNEGTGNWRFSYPVDPHLEHVGSSVGALIARDGSGSQSYAAMPYATNGTYFTASMGQTLTITTGTETITFTNDNTKGKNNISFGKTYKTAPVVSTSAGQTGYNSQWSAVSTTDFDGDLTKMDGGNGTGDKDLKWRAIGMVESNIDKNTPFTWAATDILAGTLVYQAA
jgi:hypothetical protein